MLGDSKAFSSFSVDDPQKAKAFYGQTLGLEVSEVPKRFRSVLTTDLEVKLGPEPARIDIDLKD